VSGFFSKRKFNKKLYQDANIFLSKGKFEEFDTNVAVVKAETHIFVIEQKLQITTPKIL
jgi:hypothetical protein